MRKQYDRTLKNVLRKELGSYYSPHGQIKMDYPISHEGFTIDLVFQRVTKEVETVNFPPFLLTPNLCFQFKHAGSTLYATDLDLFLGQIPIYKSQEGLSSYREVSLVLVVSNVSKSLVEDKENYSLDLIKDGVYLEEIRFRTLIMQSNNLEVLPENYPYLLISEGDKRKEFIEKILVEGNSYYVTHAYKLYKEEVRIMAEEKNIELEDLLTPEDVIEDLGVKKIIKTILEKDLLTPEDVIEDLGVKKIIGALLKMAGVKEIIEEIGIERIKEYLRSREVH